MKNPSYRQSNRNSMQKTWTLIKLINWTTDYLDSKGIEKPRLETELLLSDLLGMKRIDLYVSFEKVMSDDELRLHKSRLIKRASGTPIQYITGHTSFMGYPIILDDRVLIPRPETEVLVEHAAHFADQSGASVALELGTGSGAISIALAKMVPSMRIVATDVSETVLEVAKENAKVNEVEGRIDFVWGDLFAALQSADSGRRFDLIVSNPPYVRSDEMENLPVEIREHEPARALDGGKDGLDVIRRILAGAPDYLGPKGRLFLEIGSAQAKQVLEAIAGLGVYGDSEIKRDLAGMDRVLVARPGQGGTVG
jgi:release factor glutamine methyltransferase